VLRHGKITTWDLAPSIDRLEQLVVGTNLAARANSSWVRGQVSHGRQVIECGRWGCCRPGRFRPVQVIAFRNLWGINDPCSAAINSVLLDVTCVMGGQVGRVETGERTRFIVLPGAFTGVEGGATEPPPGTPGLTADARTRTRHEWAAFTRCGPDRCSSAGARRACPTRGVRAPKLFGKFLYRKVAGTDGGQVLSEIPLE
jgi:hypothetical protein